ncbi:MAG: hypothetical protein JW947_10500 [Sedimentisphaerales bacterium]|nr:hypothetical protein [Sedimentisphaerales bacterium]
MSKKKVSHVAPIWSDLHMRFRRVMPRSKDLTLIVLKGHLLVEEQLEKIIEDVLSSTSMLKDARLSYYQKLKLAQCIVGKKFSQKTNFENREYDFGKASEKLGELRNKLAHNIEVPKMNLLIDNFCSYFEDSITDVEIRSYVAWTPDRDKRLKFSVSQLCCALLRVRLDKHKVKSNLLKKPIN